VTTLPVPTVSVGVPVYNGERFLAQTLDSLLAQTTTDFEVIVCDNASTDDTADIARKYAELDPRVSYVRNPANIGLARNFNRVFQLSRGRYFQWAMADDLLGPTALADCVAVLDAEPRTVLVVPGWDLVDAEGAPTRREERAGIEHFEWPADTGERLQKLAEMITGPQSIAVMPYLSGMLRPEALWATHLMGDYPSSDAVLLAELARQGQFRELTEPGLQIRLHDGSAGWAIGTGEFRRVWPTFHPDRPVPSTPRLLAWSMTVHPRLLAVLASAPGGRRHRMGLSASYAAALARHGLR
jgi:glycosyltransferase involved in cell wall biosynthesis